VAHLLSVLLESTVQPRKYLHNTELNLSRRTKNLVAIAFVVQIPKISSNFTYSSGGIVFTESTTLWSGFLLQKRMVSQRSKKLPGSSRTQKFREVGHSTLSAASPHTLSLRSVQYIQPVYALSSPRSVLSSDFTTKIWYAFLPCQVT